MNKKLNLYVWDEFCEGSYSAGLAFALAETKEQAVEMIKEQLKEHRVDHLYGEEAFGNVKILSVLDTAAFAVTGGD